MFFRGYTLLLFNQEHLYNKVNCNQSKVLILIPRSLYFVRLITTWRYALDYGL